MCRARRNHHFANCCKPRAPAMDLCEFEQSVLIQQSIGNPTTPPMSGTECLNLNITTTGLSTIQRAFVKLFVELDTPVVVVNIK
jgi:hypothetical protein